MENLTLAVSRFAEVGGRILNAAICFYIMRDYSKQRKPTPEKYCAYCGKKMERRIYKSKLEDLSAFKRRKYCCWDCMRKSFVKKDASLQNNREAHASARKLVYLINGREKVCEMCGSYRNVDVHHKDHNFHNNAPENLVLVCRSCHMKLHRPANNVCSVCGKECKRTHNGMCDKHYFRWKKYGDPNHKPWSQCKERLSKGPVLQYTEDGVLVATYKDLRTAAEETKYARSSIASACNGNRKSLHGFIWKYGTNR